ncbi:set 5 [Apiospora arundinis]
MMGGASIGEIILETPHVTTYQNLRIPPNAPFTLQPTAKKGWGMYATDDINDGEIILIEKPLFVIPAISRRRCLEDAVQYEVNNLDDHSREQFFSLRKNSFEPFPSFEAAFNFNKFSRPDTTNAGNEDVGLFVLMSRANNSCRPNAAVPNTDLLQEMMEDFDSTAICMVASRDISEGEEITFTYDVVLNYLTRDQRRCAQGFAFQCGLCQSTNPHEIYLSDLRRTLLRGVETLINFGTSINVGDVIDIDENPIILEDGLRFAAARLEIMHSSRFIYYLIMACTLEAEGLLHPLEEAACVRNFNTFARWFETPFNAKIAAMALKRDTWVERLFVACFLWNRPNAADVDAAGVLLERFGFGGSNNVANIWKEQPSIVPIIEEVD